MLSDNAIRAIAAHLQGAYAAAQSPCLVTAYWPDPLDEPANPVLILHEVAESDADIANGLRSVAVPDTLLATYQLPANDVTDAGSFEADQARSRADKLVLTTAFRQAGNGDMDGLILEIGHLIHVSHPRGGPFDATQDRVRITWDATILVTPSVHT